MIQREGDHECVHIQSDYELRCDNSKEGKKKFWLTGAMQNLNLNGGWKP